MPLNVSTCAVSEFEGLLSLLIASYHNLKPPKKCIILYIRTARIPMYLFPRCGNKLQMLVYEKLRDYYVCSKQ